MSYPWVNADGSLRPFTADEIDALELETTEIKDGTNPTFELDPQGCSIRQVWFSKWSESPKAVAYLLGAASLAGTFPNWSLSRIMPQSFPKAGFEQYANLAVESWKGARSAGINDAEKVPAYKSAKLTVRSELVFFGLAPDGTVPEYNRYVEQLPSTVETNYLSIPGSMMWYRSSFGVSPDGVLIPYSVGKPEVMTRIAYKWWRVPYEAWRPGSPLYKRVHGDPTNITIVPVAGAPAGQGKLVGAPYVGCVSSADMLGYPSGYCLFEGVEEEIVPDPVRGFPCWNLIFKFLVKAVQGGTPGLAESYGGHNYLYFGNQATAAVGAAKNGYYMAIKNGAPNPAPWWRANGTIWDGVCLFNERNLINLWNVGAVPDANI